MQRLITLAIILGLGMVAYSRFQHAQTPPPLVRPEVWRFEPRASSGLAAQDLQAGTFSCDGRTYCSEMRSCDEAKYFLAHCPNTKMDGDNDGIPCERQWCNDSAR